jgi:predicted signal transduction protein with EAL and GGDEF domain
VAEQIARRVRGAVRTPEVTRGVELYVTASIGVAIADGHRSAGALLHDAEAAMRRARTLGRDRVEMFHEALRRNVARRLELAVDLRRAVDDEQLHLVYQPIVDLRRGRTVGAEALVRWQHPRRGPLGPAESIDTAENTGQILNLRVDVGHHPHDVGAPPAPRTSAWTAPSTTSAPASAR